MKKSLRVALFVLCLLVLPLLPLHAQLADSPWPMFRHDAQHTGRSSYVGPRTIALRWSYQIGFGSSPSIGSDGTLYYDTYVYTHGTGIGGINLLYAVNSDGSFQWSYQVGGAVGSSPAIAADGTLYIGSWDNRLYAVNFDGSLSWSYETGSDIVYSSPAIGSDGTLYVGSEDYRLYAMNPDGSLLWSYQSGYRVQYPPSLSINGTIYFKSEANRLFALHPNGSLLWSYHTEMYLNSSPAVAADGTLYIGSQIYGSVYGQLYAINPDVSLQWSYQRQGGIVLPAIAPDGTLYTSIWNGRLCAMKPDASFIWSYQTWGAHTTAPTIGADGIIYFGSSDNRLYGLLSNGSFQWSYQTGARGRSPVIASDGQACMYTDDSRIYCFQDPPPALKIEPGTLKAGDSFSFEIFLAEDITQPFDYYIIADTPLGPYTLYFGGKVVSGITPLFEDLQSFEAPYVRKVTPLVTIPDSMAGKQVTFYTVVVEAGKLPPVSSLSELNQLRTHVIMFAKKKVTVAP